MMSSWLSMPRWVWKDAPARRVMMWLRPLGSVSCTGSPAISGPCRGLVMGLKSSGPGSDACEGAVDVAGGQHPVNLAGRLYQQVFGGGGLADGVQQGHAGQVGG